MATQPSGNPDPAHVSDSHTFREIRARYGELLADYRFETSGEARKILESPLCSLWMAAYKAGCEHSPYLEILDDRVASFLHDSSAYEEVGPVDRVVAALSVSQEKLSLEELVGRLFAEQQAGTANADTLRLLSLAFSSYAEGFSRRSLETLALGAARALGWDRLSLPALVQRLETDYPKLATERYRAQPLRRALALLSSAEPSLNGARSRPESRRAARPDALAALRSIASGLESELAPANRDHLAGRLAALLPSARHELQRRLAQELDGALLDKVREHVFQLDAVRRPRPRYAAGARHLRRGLGLKTDLGHFIPHSAGGPADINLFHQDRSLNRGLSVQGKAYRFMEAYLEATAGLLHFTRATYSDDTPVPKFLEVGILLHHQQAQELTPRLPPYAGFHLVRPEGAPGLAWWIGVFDNQPAAQAVDPAPGGKASE